MYTALLTARQTRQLLGVSSYDTFEKRLQPFLLRLRTPGGRYRYSDAYIRVFVRLLDGQRPTEAQARMFAQTELGRMLCRFIIDRWLELAQELARPHGNALTSIEIARLAGINRTSVTRWQEFLEQKNGSFPATFTLKSVLEEVEWVWPGRK